MTPRKHNNGIRQNAVATSFSRRACPSANRRDLVRFVILAMFASLPIQLTCAIIPGFAPIPDLRTDQDIDGDGLPNEMDDDMDGDGVPNDQDPDADSDGRFDEPIIVDFPFDHNAFIEPLLPPNHPKFDYQGRLIIPAGHIDISDIIHVNLETHPLDFLEPRVQQSLRSHPDTETNP